MQKRVCVLDPLFDRRVFLAFVALLAVAAGVMIARNREISRDEILQHPDFPLIEDVAVPSAVGHGYAAPTPYSEGYQTGYDAFMMQTGQYIPRPVVSYATSSEPPQKHDPDSPEFQKGYVDGYHRATEMESCPRAYY